MRLYPAIDLKDGHAVRLQQGLFDREKIYDTDPVAVASSFVRQGASFIHTVDLDGALVGRSMNLKVLNRITESVDIPVQSGGGIRSMEQVRERLKAGADRVILGTAAVENPDFLKIALDTFGPERIVAGIDAKNGYVAVRGWKEISKVQAVDLALQMKDYGIRTVVYTDIARDGMLQGPNVSETLRLQEETGLDVIASGGVSGLEDLRRLYEAGIRGVIIGRAIYENRIRLEEAVREFEHDSSD